MKSAVAEALSATPRISRHDVWLSRRVWSDLRRELGRELARGLDPPRCRSEKVGADLGSPVWSVPSMLNWMLVTVVTTR
jgi:hypothetical protein